MVAGRLDLPGSAQGWAERVAAGRRPVPVVLNEGDLAELRSLAARRLA